MFQWRWRIFAYRVGRWAIKETTRELATELDTFISQLEFSLALLTFAGRCHRSYNLLTHQYTFPIAAQLPGRQMAHDWNIIAAPGPGAGDFFFAIVHFNWNKIHVKTFSLCTTEMIITSTFCLIATTPYQQLWKRKRFAAIVDYLPSLHAPFFPPAAFHILNHHSPQPSAQTTSESHCSIMCPPFSHLPIEMSQHIRVNELKQDTGQQEKRKEYICTKYICIYYV